MIPAWLQRILDTKNPDGVTRKARATICRKCGNPIMRGLDGEIAALAATADPHPISKLGEAIALLGGKRTYTLTWTGHRYELDYRHAHIITAKPAGEGPSNVLAEHKCGTPPLPLDDRGVITGPPPKPAYSQTVPF